MSPMRKFINAIIDINWHYWAHSVFWIAFMTFVMFTLLRNFATYGNAAQIKENSRRIDELIMQIHAINTDQNARIEALEQTVFGSMTPKLNEHSRQLQQQDHKNPPTIDSWEITRDRELRDRIRRLEEWRLQTERQP